MNALWWLLPDSCLPVLVVLVALGMIVGIVRRRSAASILGTILLVLLVGPFIEALFTSLPLWITLAVLFVMGVTLLRVVLEKLLGEHAAGYLLATALVRGVPALFRLALLPVRGLLWVAGRAVGVALRIVA